MESTPQVPPGRARWGSPPFWAALLPIVTFNISYLIAASQAHVPVCVTYLQGCTSVSSTGRVLPESLIFKPGIVATAVLLLITWHRTAGFLISAGKSPAAPFLLRFLCVVAAVSLAVYALTLGVPDPTAESMRRAGINGFAVGTSLLQIGFVLLYRSLSDDGSRRLFRWLLVLSIALPCIGIASEVAKLLGSPRNMTNNLAAWNAFLLVSAYYFCLAWLWRYHRISAGRAASPSE